MVLGTQTIERFLDVLASDAHAPGGGSVAALNGALAAALVDMVCRLSLKRAELEPRSGVLQEHSERLGELRMELLRLVDEDTEAFSAVMDAFRLPKDTDEAKALRSAAIQKGYMKAIEVPLRTARCCTEAARCASEVAQGFNASAGSDLGTGVECALAGFRGAAMNVRINLPSVKETAFVQKTEEELVTLKSALDAYRETVLKAL